tara:strand:- start:49 stop:243 length:195 start_codon:yes stop_codon:yes gene_type:complete
MTKIGDRVSLFHDIGKTGTVVQLVPVKVKTYFTHGSATNTWAIVIKWDDGTQTQEKLSDVMRID